MILEARAMGWTVKREICSGVDNYQDPCFVLYQPDGEPYAGAGADYGYDWGDKSEDEAWARVEAVA